MSTLNGINTPVGTGAGPRGDCFGLAGFSNVFLYSV
jgi:hypothetical protein